MSARSAPSAARVRASARSDQHRAIASVSVERVLRVVIDGVAAEVTGELAVEEALEIRERRAELVDGPGPPRARVEFFDARRTSATELTCTVFVTS